MLLLLSYVLKYFTYRKAQKAKKNTGLIQKNKTTGDKYFKVFKVSGKCH